MSNTKIEINLQLIPVAPFWTRCASKTQAKEEQGDLLCAWIEAFFIMANDLESDTSSTQDGTAPQSPDWLKLGVVAAASALAGGVAAAWWYRNTLSKLRQAEDSSHNPDFRSPEVDPADDL